MSENSGNDRWKSLAEDLGLPPEKLVSEVVSNAVEKQNESLPDDDLLTFTKPTDRQTIPAKAVPAKTFPIPKAVSPPDSKDPVVDLEEVIEVTFGNRRAPETFQASVIQNDNPVMDAEIVVANEQSPSDLSNNLEQEQGSHKDSSRGRGDRDRGGRGRGRGRGRNRDDRRSNNREASPDLADDQLNEGVKSGSSSGRTESQKPVLHSQKHETHLNAPDEEGLLAAESYGAHHPEQDGEIEEVDLSTWSVPSWEDLIASLYKP